jgi:hypothetical protein
LRCPVFETGETRVYDIDNVLSSYYDCSDSESESESESDSVSEPEFVVDQDDDQDDETGEEQETEPDTTDCDEFEVIQEPSS